MLKMIRQFLPSSKADHRADAVVVSLAGVQHSSRHPRIYGDLSFGTGILPSLYAGYCAAD